MTATDAVFSELADALGVPSDGLDVFVFRRVDGGRFVHLGGAGRADGWEGVVEIHLESEQLVDHAWAVGRPVRQDDDGPAQVFGPYWAASAVVVPLPPDELVIVGSQQIVAQLDDERYVALAERASGRIAAVSPAKRLADELELLHAVRKATATVADDVQTTAEHVVAAAAEALSCELGVLWLPATETLAVADTGPANVVDDHEALLSVVQGLLDDPARLPQCQQDNDVNPLPAPLASDSGVVAWFAVQLRGSVEGLLLLCHTVAKPRGFTLLCQRIGVRIAEAAGAPLSAAVTRHELHDELARASSEARRDALTGLANRLGWREAVDEFERDRRTDVASIIMLDLDELKHVNDTHGHRTGDHLLRSVADLLRAATRDTDVVARIGGDEFAILLPGAGEAVCERVFERIEQHLADHDPIGGRPLRASMGAATSERPALIDNAQRLADQRMYEAKRARRNGARPRHA